MIRLRLRRHLDEAEVAMLGDGETDWSGAGWAVGHVSQCDRCRQQIVSYRAACERLSAALPSLEQPLLDRLRSRILEAPAPSEEQQQTWRVLFGAKIAPTIHGNVAQELYGKR